MTVLKIIEIHDRDCLTYNTRLKNLKHITCIIFNHRQSRVWLEGWEFWHLDPDREAQSAAAADVLPALLAAADAEPRRHGGGALHDGQHEGPRHGRGPDQRGRDVQLLHHVLGGGRSAHEEAHLLLFGKSVWSHSFKRSWYHDNNYFRVLHCGLGADPWALWAVAWRIFRTEKLQCCKS